MRSFPVAFGERPPFLRTFQNRSRPEFWAVRQLPRWSPSSLFLFFVGPFFSNCALTDLPPSTIFVLCPFPFWEDDHLFPQPASSSSPQKVHFFTPQFNLPIFLWERLLWRAPLNNFRFLTNISPQFSPRSPFLSGGWLTLTPLFFLSYPRNVLFPDPHIFPPPLKIFQSPLLIPFINDHFSVAGVFRHRSLFKRFFLCIFLLGPRFWVQLTSPSGNFEIVFRLHLRSRFCFFHQTTLPSL